MADYHESDSGDAEVELYAVSPDYFAYSDSRAAYGRNRSYVDRWLDSQQECLQVSEQLHSPPNPYAHLPLVLTGELASRVQVQVHPESSLDQPLDSADSAV